MPLSSEGSLPPSSHGKIASLALLSFSCTDFLRLPDKASIVGFFPNVKQDSLEPCSVPVQFFYFSFIVMGLNQW
jgi:hypothetical protein